MLRIGARTYKLVLAQSGFTVWIHPESQMEQLRQQWMLDAHYVPAEDSPELRSDGEDEHLRVVVESERYQVKDWRELTGLGLEPIDEDGQSTWFGSAYVQNLLVGWFDKEHFRVVPGDLTVKRAGEYLFDCEFDGTMENGGEEEELHLVDKIPFAKVCLNVPVNVKDPVSWAHTRAMRHIGPFEIESSRVKSHDYRRKENPEARLVEANQVALRTAWRKVRA